MGMDLLAKVIFPMKRVCRRVALRLGIRRSGLLKLRGDVRACQYQDVHVMWEMIKRNERESAPSPYGKRKRPLWRCFGWTRFASCLGRSL